MSRIQRVLPVFVMLAALLGTTGAPFAQSSTGQAKAEAAPRWIVNCSNAASPDILVCSLSVTLLQAGTRQKVLSATVFKGAESPEMASSLPHGLDLLSGIVITVDRGTGQSYPIQTSNADGAYSSFPLLLQWWRP